MSSSATPLSDSRVLLRTGFHAHVDRTPDEVVVWLHGDLDMSTSGELRQTLARVLGDAPARVAVDLSGLEFVDSTGIGVLIGGFRRAKDEGCDLTLRFPTRSVTKVLHLTGVDQMMSIEASQG